MCKYFNALPLNIFASSKNINSRRERNKIFFLFFIFEYQKRKCCSSEREREKKTSLILRFVQSKIAEKKARKCLCVHMIFWEIKFATQNGKKQTNSNIYLNFFSSISHKVEIV